MGPQSRGTSVNNKINSANILPPQQQLQQQQQQQVQQPPIQQQQPQQPHIVLPTSPTPNCNSNSYNGLNGETNVNGQHLMGPFKVYSKFFFYFI